MDIDETSPTGTSMGDLERGDHWTNMVSKKKGKEDKLVNIQVGGIRVFGRGDVMEAIDNISDSVKAVGSTFDNYVHLSTEEMSNVHRLLMKQQEQIKGLIELDEITAETLDVNDSLLRLVEEQRGDFEQLREKSLEQTEEIEYLKGRIIDLTAQSTANEIFWEHKLLDLTNAFENRLNVLEQAKGQSPDIGLVEKMEKMGDILKHQNEYLIEHETLLSTMRSLLTGQDMRLSAVENRVDESVSWERLNNIVDQLEETDEGIRNAVERLSRKLDSNVEELDGEITQIGDKLNLEIAKVADDLLQMGEKLESNAVGYLKLSEELTQTGDSMHLTIDDLSLQLQALNSHLAGSNTEVSKLRQILLDVQLDQEDMKDKILQMQTVPQSESENKSEKEKEKESENENETVDYNSQSQILDKDHYNAVKFGDWEELSSTSSESGTP